jgi:hypothetical protein
MTITARRATRRERRILAALPPVTVPARPVSNDPTRDPDWCWTCGRKCGSQPH